MKPEAGFTHIDEKGDARMVDVGRKPVISRTAVAEGRILLATETLHAIQNSEIPKGDVFSVARIAAIQAAKRTDDLIPLCHSLPLDVVTVDFTFEESGVLVTASAKCSARTGVEMEALTAVSVAALTVYDMCKAVDKQMKITDIRLVKKIKEDSLSA